MWRSGFAAGFRRGGGNLELPCATVRLCQEACPDVVGGKLWKPLERLEWPQAKAALACPQNRNRSPHSVGQCQFPRVVLPRTACWKLKCVKSQVAAKRQRVRLLPTYDRTRIATRVGVCPPEYGVNT